MVQWNGQCRVALTELFDKRLADPTLTKSQDIDPYYDLAPISKGCCKIERSRTNFRNHASDYLREQAMSGKRRREFAFLFVLSSFLDVGRGPQLLLARTIIRVSNS